MSGSSPEIVVESLLAHRTWVRELARRLATDAAAADDIGQEVWLAALRRPPADGRSPRGWLRTVAVNAARKHGRGERRRVRREERAGPVEPSASAAELAGRADAHRRLVAAVVALPEPVRQAVLLRYFEGLGLREVADRMEAPFETTRKRIRRGLDLLRGRLSGEEEDGRNALAAVLIPLLARPERGGAAGTATIAGGVLMATKTKFAVAAAILLMLAGGTAVLLGGGGEDAPREPDPAPVRVGTAPADEGGATVGESATAPVSEPRAGAGAPPESTPAEAAPKPVDVEVRLRTKVNGIEWKGTGLDRVFSEIAARAGVPLVIAESAATEIANQKMIIHLGVRKECAISDILDLVTMIKGFAWGIHADRVVINVRGREYDPDEPVVTPPPSDWNPDAPTFLTARGVVRDPDGKAVPGATVWFWRPGGTFVAAATADADGAFEVEVRKPWPRLVARAPGRIGSLAWRAKGEYGETFDLDLPLRGRAALVSGTVRDEAGEPVAGATVAVGYTGEWVNEVMNGPQEPAPFPVETRDDGSFRDECAPPGVHRIRAAFRGYREAIVERDLAAGQETRVELRLTDGVVVAGRVTDDLGRPVAGAKVEVREGRYAPFGRATTGSDGIYRISGLPENPRMEVSVEGKNKETARMSLDPAAGPVYRWDPVLTRAVALAGTVVDENGEPMSGYRARSLPERLAAPRGMAGTWAGAATTTDDDGAFRLTGVDPVPCRFGVTPPTQSIPVAVITADPGAGGEVRIVVPASAQPSASVALRALDPAGKPVRAQVGVEHVASGVEFWIRTGEDGRFESRALPPGWYRLALQDRDLGTLDLGRHELRRDQRLDLSDVRFPVPARLTVRRPSGSSKTVSVAVVALRDGTLGRTVLRLYLGPGEEGGCPLVPGRYRVLLQGFDVMGEEREIELVSGEETVVEANLGAAPVRSIDPGLPAGSGGRAALLTFRDAKGGIVFRHVVERKDVKHAFPAFEAPFVPGRSTVTASAVGGVNREGVLEVPGGKSRPESLSIRFR